MLYLQDQDQNNEYNLYGKKQTNTSCMYVQLVGSRII